MKIFIATIFMLMTITSFGQYDMEENEKDTIPKAQKTSTFELQKNISVGSSLNLLLGNYTFVYLAPQIGYDIKPKINIGLQGMYQYTRINYSGYVEYANVFGGGIYARYRPIEKLILETSVNLYRIKYGANNTTNTFKLNANSWLAGIGYARPLGEKAFANFLISYDILGHENNPEPIIFSINKFNLYYKFCFILYPFN
ncbi:hypothetical protein DNU06_11530 [Putridiphycobacter roseus]|uniref:Outer membrane protein beta-barrel domain-containing protein n=1 Tax=Putridiphycobacter roseus TaxID=2219161 RepID=A0A2W1N1R0_9FLAO|nr:hypothetical protein [Putridiphycobacter roseus]PZE16881.1 hypothetical protein DNU06_11530 [Putridiphycobacter roseus]